jgi:carnitine-CoA ligase
VPAASGAPGEKDVVAAVVVERARFDAADVLAWCRQKLEPNFVPSFLQVVAEIPKTASEKPQDRFLIEALGAPDAEVYAPRGAASVRLQPGAALALAS